MTPTEPAFPMSQAMLHWTARDGRDLIIRHIRSEDAVLLVELFGRLSPETVYLRFATYIINVPMKRVLQEATRFATLEPINADALVALYREDDTEHIIAVSRLAGATEESAEFALLVRDDFQAAGIGTMMFDLIVQVALVRDLKFLTASVVADNLPMIKLIRRLGFPYELHTSHGETEVVIWLQPQEQQS